LHEPGEIEADGYETGFSQEAFSQDSQGGCGPRAVLFPAEVMVHSCGQLCTGTPLFVRRGGLQSCKDSQFLAEKAVNHQK
jgi:hypothetical protein